MIYVHTDDDEFSVSTDTENRGFELRYKLIPCGAPNILGGSANF